MPSATGTALTHRNPATPYRQGFLPSGHHRALGRGTQKIVELCVKAGHPESEFGEQTSPIFVGLNSSSQRGAAGEQLTV